MRPILSALGLVLSLALPALAGTPAERARAAASLVWVHGVNEALALREIGPEGVPALLELLQDRDFERRDNVVAFLAYLGGEAEVQALTAFREHPPVENDRPEEYRARLLVPEALGRIAARGSAQAHTALQALRADRRTAAGSALDQMIDHGMKLAREAPSSAQPSDIDYGQGTGAAGQTLDPGSIDPADEIERINITSGLGATGTTFANHVNTNSPITNARVDELLADVSFVMGADNGSDVACCVTLNRAGPGVTFGTSGDGLDVITTATELNQVLGNAVARVKIVDSIQECGGPGSNIIGCAPVPGDGMAVVRLSGAFDEGLLWAHEFGHNTGLGHNASLGYIMYGGLSSGNTRLTATECNRYHNPSGAAHVVPVAVGECHDYDGDAIVSSVDNCPLVANGTQVNGDGDPVGDACDNCPLITNADQADCDVDQIGNVCDPSSDPPGPIGPLTFTTRIRITWPAVSVTKRIYRGSFAAQPFVFNHTLIGTATPFFQFYQDTAVPPVETLYYYLVTGLNACGEGS